MGVGPDEGGMTGETDPLAAGGVFRIGLSPIPTTAWLEGGEAEPATRKDSLFRRARPLVWAETVGSRPAQLELAALIAEATGRAVDTEAYPPLYAAAREVADDLCLMERRDGAWRLTALSLSAGSFFAAEEVIGRSLAELHGPVPGFGAALLPRVERIFDNLNPQTILERRNWSVVSSPDLHIPDPAPMRAAIPKIRPARAGEALCVRSERQTLRRLPETGAIVFTIRVWITSVAEIASEPAKRATFANAWRTASADFRAYKRLDLYDSLIDAVLAGR
jgi:dimethylamine monooxygenase subunit A